MQCNTVHESTCLEFLCNGCATKTRGFLNQGSKRTHKAKDSHEHFQRRFWTIWGQYPASQGFWGKSGQKSHPEGRQNLCHTCSLWHFLRYWLPSFTNENTCGPVFALAWIRETSFVELFSKYLPNSLGIEIHFSATICRPCIRTLSNTGKSSWRVIDVLVLCHSGIWKKNSKGSFLDFAPFLGPLGSVHQ